MFPILFEFPDWVPGLGGQPVTTFGVMMFFAFLTGGFLIRREMEREGLEGERAWDLVFMAVIGGVVGAKLYYVGLNWSEFQAQGLRYLFSRGGMVWYGGFILATAFVVWEIRRRELPLGKMADIVAPPLAISYAVGRVGCFLVGDDWGRPTDSWVGMTFPQGSPPTTVTYIERFGVTVPPEMIAKYGDVIPVHPTQLYEVAMSTLIFLFLWRIRKHSHRAGWLFMVWLALAGVERFVVEFFRAKDDRFFGIFTVAQLISIALIVVGLVWAARLRASSADRPEPVPAG